MSLLQTQLLAEKQLFWVCAGVLLIPKHQNWILITVFPLVYHHLAAASPFLFSFWAAYLVEQLECLLHLQDEVHGDVLIEQAEQLPVVLLRQQGLLRVRGSRGQRRGAAAALAEVLDATAANAANAAAAGGVGRLAVASEIKKKESNSLLFYPV